MAKIYVCVGKIAKSSVLKSPIAWINNQIRANVYTIALILAKVNVNVAQVFAKALLIAQITKIARLCVYHLAQLMANQIVYVEELVI